MIDRTTRSPNARDRDAINAKIATIDKDRREEILLSSLVAGFGVIVAAVVLYLNRPVTPVFAGIVGAVLIVAVAFGGPDWGGWKAVVDWKSLRESKTSLAELRALLAGGTFHVLHCTATDVIGIGAEADDIDDYVFQVDANQMLVVPSWAEMEQGFPSSEFEIVALTDSFSPFFAIHSIGMHLKLRGVIDPERVKNPEYPFDEMVVAGKISELTR